MMSAITIDTEARQLADELLRRGVSGRMRIHAVIEVRDDAPDMAVVAASGRSLDWLADEPELYTDADLLRRDV